MHKFYSHKKKPISLGNLKLTTALPVFLGIVLFVDMSVFIIHLFLPMEPLIIERAIDFFVFLLLFLALFVPLILDHQNLKKTDQALRESEANYRAIVEDQTELICRFSREGIILFANTSFCNFFGYTKESIIGSSMETLFSTCKELLVYKTAQEVTPSHPIANTECMLENTSGEMRWIVWKVRAIFETNAAGNDHLLHYQAVGNDATTQRQALLELQEIQSTLEERVRERTQALVTSNEQIRLHMTAMESIAEGIVITDREGSVQWCNPAMTMITGYSVDEIIGQRLSLLKSGKHPREFYQTLWNTILNGDPWQGVLINRRKDGNLYFEEQTITPVKNKSGKIERFIAIKHDITKRELAEQEILHHNWELRTLNYISSQIYVTLNKQEIFTMLAELLPKEIPHVAGAIYSRDASTGILFMENCWGPFTTNIQNGEERESPLQAAVDQSVQERKVYFVAEHPPETLAYIITPLVYGDQVVGILLLTSKNLENRHIHFFKALGNQVGAAVQNAILYQEEAHLRQVAEIISSASQKLVQTLDLNVVLTSMLEFLSKVVFCDLAHAMLVDGNEILASRAHLIKRQKGDTGRLEISALPMKNHPLLNEVLAQKKTVLVADTSKYQDHDPSLFTPDTRCWLGLPLRAGSQVIGAAILESNQAHKFTADHISSAELLVNQAAIAIQNAWLFEQVREGGNRLQMLSRRLVEVQETERKYIARELHDEASQALVGLKFGIDILRSEAGNPQAVITGAEKLEQGVQEVLDNLHRLAANLRPASLDHLGLIPALRQFVEGINENYGLTVELRFDGTVERLPQNVEISFYRIIQEALNNTIRHAKATRAEVFLRKKPGCFVVSIMDDGIGFDQVTALKGDRMGLLGMRERAEMVGGVLNINSVPGGGTTIFVEIPYDN